MVRSGETVMAKVRQYRAIASLYRQTAAFRPHQRWSLLDQAEEWERLAVTELEAYFDACNDWHDDRQPQAARCAGPRWETALGRGADMQHAPYEMSWERTTTLAA
jgi:hypothetical protein